VPEADDLIAETDNSAEKLSRAGLVGFRFVLIARSGSAGLCCNAGAAADRNPASGQEKIDKAARAREGPLMSCKSSVQKITTRSTPR